MSSPVVGVTKSFPSLVGPAVATPAGSLLLTAMDAAMASLPMAALFIFDRPIDQPAKTIRTALSRTLVPYYPIAGRVGVASSTPPGHHTISCTGQGVAFVAARAGCTLHDARLTDRSPTIPVEELTVTYAGQYTNKKGPGRPFLLMQVTEFSCGGFVVGVTWDHVIADGVGMAEFLQTVGESVRGVSSLPSSLVPVRLDTRLPDLPPPITCLANSLVNSAHNEFPCSYITLPMTFVNRIKAEYRERLNGEQPYCSSFEVFVAAIWKCRARATITSDDSAHQQQQDSSPVALAFTANVRKQADAKDGYYGNLFTFGLAVATRGEVANGDILDLVNLVKDAKARVPYTFMDGAAYVGAEMGGRLRDLPVYDILYVTSWWNLGFDDIDFGAGGPARVMGNMERRIVPACILCGRKDKADGVAAMAMCVRKEHEEAFYEELRRLQ
ncbi:hypothetical protein QOZ80_4AG0326460 [Eleusine coracana subsp. coracana]|nr:hypothetical protein QOZ80_4AG0326460 [Eleusine coracana subsp. coracana]